ncbi:MAG: endonuclease/exonuclease/phosphatase family protein [Bacillota bacterium]
MKAIIRVCLVITAIIVIIATGAFSIDFSSKKPVKYTKLPDDSRNVKIASRGSLDTMSSVQSRKESDLDLDISIMTYNIHRGINKKGKHDLDSIREVLENSGADIIALQEVERNSIRTMFKDQVKFLADKLSMYYAYGKSLSILNGQYGNAVLSRYPIEEYEVIQLPYKDERRTVLKASIAVGDYKLAVFNTHLGLSNSERDEQLVILREIIKNESMPFLLMGDFNTNLEDLNVFEGIARDSAGFTNVKPDNTFESEELNARIDYIFVSEGIVPHDYQTIKSDASDHYPVICKINIK